MKGELSVSLTVYLYVFHPLYVCTFREIDRDERLSQSSSRRSVRTDFVDICLMMYIVK